MNVIILCGGLSTRLGEITKSTPKILLDVGGKTVLDWQLEKIKELGVTEVYLAAGHLAHTLQDIVGSMRLGLNIHHIIEPKKLGTGGAIKFAIENIEGNGPYIVLNGDVLYTHSFVDMMHAYQPYTDGLMLGVRVEDASTYGTLEYSDNKHLTAFKEKEGRSVPGYINGGLYVFSDTIQTYFPTSDEFSIEYDVFPYIKHMYVYESDTPWVDIGVPERLDWARSNYSQFVL
jgi:NDP-sugar pyrophosphorylase family protein